MSIDGRNDGGHHNHGDHHHGNHDHDHSAPPSFDDEAATWDDDPEKLQNARDIATAIKRRLPLSTDMRVLEYGAGTGLLTQSLRDSIGHAVLADVSEGMLEVMRHKVADDTIPDAEVIRLDLADTSDAADRTREELGEFDLVASMLALHHIPDTDAALRGMHNCLTIGGLLALADLAAEDGSFHGSDRHDVHRGFTREELIQHLHNAGFAEVTVEDAATINKNGSDFTVLLATARRPA